MESSQFWQPLGHGINSVVWRTKAKIPHAHNSSKEVVKSAGTAPKLKDTLSRWVAVKSVQDTRMIPPHDILREAAILQAISHPNIISVLTFIQGDTSTPSALYMPLIPLSLTLLLSSPLFTPTPLTGPYSALCRPVFAASQGPDKDSPFDIITKSVAYQLILAIAHLHSLDPPVAHRDINPANVLIDHDGTVKLIDFGIAWAPGFPRSAGSSTKSQPFHDWTETEEKMCCEVSTGPYRAPELLFSPQSYSATAIDLWSLGATIAECFTPLRLVPSHSPSSPSFVSLDEEGQAVSKPFLISSNLRSKIDYRATWERLPLFNAEHGELGLAWSIFKLRGTPTKETWPTFGSLPAANKLEFQAATRKPLQLVLPHLPPRYATKNAGVTDAELYESPLSLLDSLLTYSPDSRLTATRALNHPWFSDNVLLPSAYPHSDFTKGRVNLWGERALGQWLEPLVKREVSKVTTVGPSTR